MADVAEFTSDKIKDVYKMFPLPDLVQFVWGFLTSVLQLWLFVFIIVVLCWASSETIDFQSYVFSTKFKNLKQFMEKIQNTPVFPKGTVDCYHF